MTTRVTFASDWTSSDGEHYKAGTTTELHSGDARSLLKRGRVRLAPEEKPGHEPSVETQQSHAADSGSESSPSTDNKARGAAPRAPKK